MSNKYNEWKSLELRWWRNLEFNRAIPLWISGVASDVILFRYPKRLEKKERFMRLNTTTNIELKRSSQAFPLRRWIFDVGCSWRGNEIWRKNDRSGPLLLVHLLVHANFPGIIRGTGVHPDPKILRKTQNILSVAEFLACHDVVPLAGEDRSSDGLPTQKSE